ncbi:hypothetical protein CBR_g34868 [Chara braunii]|uniref:Uncharacterized protein n=1 Tax=Chara braunii TaxID=69332 RepID=A0A388LJV3_CHABU|nr:hypothetical protein CBR_g34868 [Chara braunii]|eukprot:GBG82492.1 hypothetical protein CBR_g34868 [Chara braunii]
MGRTGKPCSQCADGVLANGALSEERYDKGMKMTLTANLKQAATNWIYKLKEGQRRLREMVTLVSSTACDWSGVERGETSRTVWLEDKRQRMMNVLWELEEGPDPQLEDLLDWQLADSLMSDCYAIYEEGSDLCDKGAICTSGCCLRALPQVVCSNFQKHLAILYTNGKFDSKDNSNSINNWYDKDILFYTNNPHNNSNNSDKLCSYINSDDDIFNTINTNDLLHDNNSASDDDI